MGRKPLPHHENFREYSLEEIAKVKKEVCKKHKCPYMKLTHSSGYLKKVEYSAFNNACNTYCDYLCMTGKRRDCMPDKCTHYKDKNVKKRINPKTGFYESLFT